MPEPALPAVASALPRRIILINVVLLLSLVGAFWIPVRHATRLVEHMFSGNWEIQSGDRTIDSYLRTSQANKAPDGVIILPGGSGDGWPLGSEAERKDTFRKIGTLILARDRPFDVSGPSLPGWYSEELDHLAADPQRGGLSREQVAEARARFDERSFLINDRFLPFQVGSTPAFSRLDEINLSSVSAQPVVLPQRSRCAATLGPLNSTGAADDALANSTADVVVSPRLLMLRLDRPWLDGAAFDGLLRRLPTGPIMANDKLYAREAVILLSDLVEITPHNRDQFGRIARMTKDGSCCRIVCAGNSLAVRPATVTYGDRKIFAVKALEEPMLYALVADRIPAQFRSTRMH